MHRRFLLELLARYATRWPAEHAVAARIRALVESRADCLERGCLPGHVTASAWIASADRRCFLMARHRKLGRWLQLGGHVDGEGLVHRAALREAREESGLEHFTLLGEGGALVPLDLDVHPIPARGAEPAHEHHDVRFLLVAAPGQLLRMSEESTALAWFDNRRLAELAGDDSVRRLGRKALRLLGAAGSLREFPSF